MDAINHPPVNGEDKPVVPVFFVSDSTGITSEAMGNALLVQFPHLTFTRTTVPFLGSLEAARELVARLDMQVAAGRTPLVFSTAVDDEIRDCILSSKATVIDLLSAYLGSVERALGTTSVRRAKQLHTLADSQRYNSRMQAIEFAIEHDDGQSLRALEQADIILLAPSRCGKTPTSMYLALQHGLFAANYPLVDEDFESTALPRPVRKYQDRLFGIVTSTERLCQVRNERRPNSRYASRQQVSFELRGAKAMMKANGIPYVDSSTKSVEEMSAMILQYLSITSGR
ncbi:pyruvate, water dikinase regulatory protein [Corynebacterium sp. HMSC04H06]|uniref:pyruvate, water dikinase regulatory protein n=1 Tax=Corynebacterium sp. HMSC04H06 TaxID=1581050 RepID=UPI0008A14E04|nr:pyruvate, water dikinase regulatory protein [Corynebacterium sp. HMSC04H06]OFS23797.1 phosphoenolpyruvate synthase regulatory protein [Corynebacterium sp. HMSC04H06]